MAEFPAEFFNFIAEHKHDDPQKLRLKYAGKNAPFNLPLAITQIECRRKYAAKLSDTLTRAGSAFIFPDTLSAEQCTSDALAEWHARLVEPGVSVTDMTAGLGIDCLHIAAIASSVTAIERKEALAATLEHNAAALGIRNMSVICGDSVTLLEQGPIASHTVFIDPARRAADGSRLFSIADCQPDITALLPPLRANFRRLIAKLSPMLDMTQTARLLPGITALYAVGTPRECKELVAVVSLDSRKKQTEADLATLPLHAVTISADGSVQDLAFTATEEAEATVSTAVPEPGDFLYEPYPAVLKSGAFSIFAARFDLSVISDNTHVYLSKGTPSAPVPADVHRIAAVIPWQSKHLKRLSRTWPAADVAVRNFGMSADALRAKLGVRPAAANAPYRILGVTTAQGNRLLLILTPNVHKSSNNTQYVFLS